MVNANAASDYNTKRRKKGEDISSNIRIGVTEECLNGLSVSRNELVSGEWRFPCFDKMESPAEKILVEFENVQGFKNQDFTEFWTGFFMGCRHFSLKST